MLFMLHFVISLIVLLLLLVTLKIQFSLEDYASDSDLIAGENYQPLLFIFCCILGPGNPLNWI